MLSEWLDSRLSSLGPVEHNPDGKVGREILETVNLASRNEQKGTGLNRVARVSIEKETVSTGDEIDFVARMGLLRIDSCVAHALGLRLSAAPNSSRALPRGCSSVTGRRVKLNREGAVRKNWEGKIARWWRAFCQSIKKETWMIRGDFMRVSATATKCRCKTSCREPSPGKHTTPELIHCPWRWTATNERPRRPGQIGPQRTGA